MKGLHVCVLSLLLTECLGQKIGVSSELGFSCWNCADRYDFGCDELYNVSCKCRNLNFMGTVLACVSKHGQNGMDVDKGYSYVQTNCKYNGDKVYTKEEMASIYHKTASLLIDSGNIDGLTSVYAPVLVDSPQFTPQFKQAATAKKQYYFGTVLGIALLGYWGLIIAVTSVLNLLKSKFPRALEKITPQFIDSFRQQFVLPATFKGSHSRPVKLLGKLKFAAPTRGQSLILVTYFVLNIVCLATIVDWDTTEDLLRYIGNRSGIIAFIQLPLTLIFSCRNSPLIYLTGWPYSTFQVYHRWVGRMLVIQGLVHSVCFTWLAVLTQSTIFRWKNVHNWRFGNLALLASLLMLGLSVQGFRKVWYETFIVLHKILFFIIVLGLWMHCDDFGWMPWLYLSIGIFVADRVIRIGKVAYSGVATAHFRVIDKHSIRVNIEYSNRWKPYPGAYVYIRLLKKNLFWQAHPFSIYCTPGQDDLQLVIKTREGATNRLYQMALNDKSSKVLIEGPYGNPPPLRNYENIALLAGGVGVTTMFSHAVSLTEKNHRVLFIWVIPDATPLGWFGDEIQQLEANENVQLEIYITQSMFVEQAIAAVAAEAANQQRRRLEQDDRTISIDPTDNDVYNLEEPKVPFSPSTFASSLCPPSPFQPAPPSPLIPMSTRVAAGGATPRFSVQSTFASYVYHKRPNIQQEVTRYITASSGRVAVLSCGPPGFLDNIRKSVARNLHATQSRMDYFEEAFAW